MTNTRTKSTLPLQVQEEIARDILAGELKPGDKILEELYANRLNVSRATVREAIGMLITQRIATKISNRGTFLNLYSLDDHITIYRLRTCFIQMAMEKVSQLKAHDSAALATELYTYATQFVQHRDDIYTLLELHHKFQKAIITASGDAILERNYPSFYISLQFLHQQPKFLDILAHTEHNLDAEPLQEYQDIAKAIAKRDFTTAHNILEAHNTRITQVLEDYKATKQRLNIESASA